MLANFARLLLQAARAVLFVNSTPAGHTLVAAGRPGAMQWVEPVPAWVAPFRESEPSA